VWVWWLVWVGWVGWMPAGKIGLGFGFFFKTRAWFLIFFSKSGGEF
jgi:hypothetical protein